MFSRGRKRDVLCPCVGILESGCFEVPSLVFEVRGGIATFIVYAIYTIANAFARATKTQFYLVCAFSYRLACDGHNSSFAFAFCEVSEEKSKDVKINPRQAKRRNISSWFDDTGVI